MVSATGHALIAKSEIMRAEGFDLLGTNPTSLTQRIRALSQPPRRIVPTPVAPKSSITITEIPEDSASSATITSKKRKAMDVVPSAASAPMPKSRRVQIADPVISQDALSWLKSCTDWHQITVDDLVHAFPLVWPQKYEPMSIKGGKPKYQYQCTFPECTFVRPKKNPVWTHVAEHHVGKGVRCALCEKEHLFYNPDSYRRHFERGCTFFNPEETE